MNIAGFREVNEILARRFADSPLGKMSEGKMSDKPASEYDRSLGMLDDNNNEYIVDGKLLPNTTYVLNGNIYRTDGQGRIVSCESTPRRTPENIRDNHAQTTVGGENRRSGDQGGHIVSRETGGDAGPGNLLSMDSRINQSDYKRMENYIKKALDEGKNVSVKTEIEYSGDSVRPDKVTTTVVVDGKESVFTFDNNMDGALLDKVKETGSKSDVAVVESVLNDTGGTVSSIKEEFSSEGRLDTATVSVTYEGADGKSYRQQIVIDNDGGGS